jgi:hypothetical protein
MYTILKYKNLKTKIQKTKNRYGMATGLEKTGVAPH